MTILPEKFLTFLGVRDPRAGRMIPDNLEFTEKWYLIFGPSKCETK